MSITRWKLKELNIDPKKAIPENGMLK